MADNRPMRQWIVTIVVLLGLCVGVQASADQKDPRLDKLFAQLKAAATDEDGMAIESQIWDIWLKSGDENVDALMSIGVAAMDSSDLPQAYQAFDRIVHLAPNFAEGWNKRATVLYYMGRFKESLSDIDKTLALEPRHFGALSGRGLCDVELKQEKEALDAFEQALAVNPHMPMIRQAAEDVKKSLADKSI
jgi:tetratricopeptide (TPR) repeat protein